MSLDDESLENLKRASACFPRAFPFTRKFFHPRVSHDISRLKGTSLFVRRNPLGWGAHPLILAYLPACILVLGASTYSRAYRCTRSAWRAHCTSLFAYLHTRRCIRDARHGIAGSRWARKDFRLPFFPSFRHVERRDGRHIEVVVLRSDIWCRWNFDAPAAVRIRRPLVYCTFALSNEIDADFFEILTTTGTIRCMCTFAYARDYFFHGGWCESYHLSYRGKITFSIFLNVLFVVQDKSSSREFIANRF